VSGGGVVESAGGRETIEDLRRRVQARIRRYEPREAARAAAGGATLVDLRSHDEPSAAG
jgi:hypothetical protein